MFKRLISLAVLLHLLLFQHLSAQYVLIPDSNFGSWLSANGYNSCVSGNNANGWYLDTTCNSVSNASVINCSNSNIRDLSGIQYFHKVWQLSCANNPLLSIPALSDSLTYLDCHNGQLVSLPNLPYRLSSLYCYSNRLSYLPLLPSSLTLLACYSNQLISLPPIPRSLTDIEAQNNPSLYCLPLSGSQHFDFFYISGTAITCLPFSVSASNADIQPYSLPLCDPLSGCDFYDNIGGIISIDTVAQCTSDSLYTGSRLSHIKVALYQSGKAIQQVYSSSSGGYSFKTDSLADYRVQIDTTELPFHLNCPVVQEYDVHLSPTDSSILNRNFSFDCTSVESYGVASMYGNFRPTYQHPVYVDAGNLAKVLFGSSCNGRSESGDIDISYTGPGHVTTAPVGDYAPLTINSNSITFHIQDLDLLVPGQLGFSFYVDSMAQVGDRICFTAISTPDNQNLKADTFKECFLVQNSYDPNFKEVYPANHISQDAQWLTYTLHFQNTGNDSAYLVVIKDTLHRNLDVSTFQYITASHRVVVQIFDSVAVFIFPHIMLPDSATNSISSEGWIKYRIKTKPDLSPGTSISNNAFIYFDNNVGVKTNTTFNIVDTVLTDITGYDLRPDYTVKIYPNPNNGNFILETNQLIGKTFTISDILGKIIGQGEIQDDTQNISMKGLSEGVYMISVGNDKTHRFIVTNLNN